MGGEDHRTPLGHDTYMKTTFLDGPMQHVFASPETRETMLSHTGRS